MNVIYSPRAARDLEAIATYHHAVAGPRIAAAIGARIEHVINLVSVRP
jgi:plasmid stabilization system protein ParE